MKQKNTSTTILIKELTLKDLKFIAQVHIGAFPKNFLTKFGQESVRRYYHWLLTGPHDVITQGAFINAELAGFFFGGVFRGATAGFFRQDWLYLILQVLLHPWLIFNSEFRKHLAYAIRVLILHNKPIKPSKAEKTATVKLVKSFAILSIAVSPLFQRKGIGKHLLEEAESIARQRDFVQMHLTVHLENTQAIGFYKKLSWEEALVENDTWKGKMIKKL